MDSVCINEIRTDDSLLKNQLFVLNESHLRINCINEIVDFNLNEISNVRYSKKRNYSINNILTLIFVLVYFFGLSFFNESLFKIFSTALLLILVFMLFSIKNYSYLLLININNFGFRELKISQKNSLNAEDFVLIFKSQYFNEAMRQNNLDFINRKFSS